MWWVILGILSYLAVPLLLPVFAGQKRQNYLGEAVPTGLGLAFVLPGSFMMVARLQKEEYAGLFALALLFFAVLGAIDDVHGEEGRKGFRGHFSIRQLSTGALKAWGGVAFSLAIASSLGTGIWQIALNGLNMALMANFLNLLDLRPGRAGKTFVLLGLAVFFLRPDILGPLFGMVWAVGGFLFWDLRRSAMMGDSGSNALGAVLGLACAISFPLVGRILLCLVLLGLNALSERISFSEVIESNRLLRYFDQLGR